MLTCEISGMVFRGFFCPLTVDKLYYVLFLIFCYNKFNNSSLKTIIFQQIKNAGSFACCPSRQLAKPKGESHILKV